jgi:hypothetical protein
MTAQYILSRGAARLGALILVMSVVPGNTGATQKMKPAELVGKHLAAIGTPEARAAVRNRAASGAATVLLTPAPKIQNAILVPPKQDNRSEAGASADQKRSGNAVFISAGESVRLGLHFSASDYGGEDLAYDGKKLRPHVYGRLSVPVELISEGLLGGTLTTTWALLDHAKRRPRLEYKGLKKLAGREYHELQYLFRKDYGNRHVVDIRALMYFDPQTFRHIKTECRILDVAGSGKGTSMRTHTLTEEFADFAVADRLTLPRTYKLRYSSESNRHTTTTEWNVTFEEIRHNQQLDANAFVLK